LFEQIYVGHKTVYVVFLVGSANDTGLASASSPTCSLAAVHIEQISISSSALSLCRHGPWRIPGNVSPVCSGRLSLQNDRTTVLHIV